MNEYIDLYHDKLSVCMKFAKSACIGGRSNIRTNAADRQKKLLTDNFIGQIGALAGAIFLYGEEKGMEEYIAARELADKNPHVGDKGQDIIGKNIDIKCSFMRRSKNPDSYNVLIRPREVHPNWIYLQTLADKIVEEDSTFFRVHIMGWISTAQLPKSVEKSGPFEGAYKLSVKDLNKTTL